MRLWVGITNYDWFKLHASNPNVEEVNFWRPTSVSAFFGSGGMYVFEDCDPVDAMAATVEFAGVNSASGYNYVDEVLVTGEKPEIKTAEAIIEGRFDAQASSGCWRPKYRIAATKIELVSPAIEYVPPASDGLTSKH